MWGFYCCCVTEPLAGTNRLGAGREFFNLSHARALTHTHIVIVVLFMICGRGGGKRSLLLNGRAKTKATGKKERKKEQGESPARPPAANLLNPRPIPPLPPYSTVHAHTRTAEGKKREMRPPATGFAGGGGGGGGKNGYLFLNFFLAATSANHIFCPRKSFCRKSREETSTVVFGGLFSNDAKWRFSKNTCYCLLTFSKFWKNKSSVFFPSFFLFFYLKNTHSEFRFLSLNPKVFILL